jgi:hypothetical protein
MPKVNQNFVHHYKNPQIALTRDEVILITFTSLASSQYISLYKLLKKIGIFKPYYISR